MYESVECATKYIIVCCTMRVLEWGSYSLQGWQPLLTWYVAFPIGFCESSPTGVCSPMGLYESLPKRSVWVNHQLVCGWALFQVVYVLTWSMWSISESSIGKPFKKGDLRVFRLERKETNFRCERRSYYGWGMRLISWQVIHLIINRSWVFSSR